MLLNDKMLNDPIKHTLLVTQKLYPNISAEILYTDNYDDEGLVYTLFPNDDSTPIIVIDVSVPFNTLPGILAHELAHIVVGIEENHRELWDNVR